MPADRSGDLPKPAKAVTFFILIAAALIMWGILIGAIIFGLVATGHAAGSFTWKNWLAVGIITPILGAIYFPIIRWTGRAARRGRERNRAYLEELRRRREVK